MTSVESACMLTLGIYSDGEHEALLASVKELRNFADDIEIILLGSQALPDSSRFQVLAELPQLLIGQNDGAPAAFNRLAGYREQGDILFLEAGTILVDECLARLRQAIAASVGAALAGPSTNRVWNEQCLAEAPHPGASTSRLNVFARTLEKRYGDANVSLAPLYSLSDFCLLVKREVIETIGGADESYAKGPCWEMDYNIRAARSGFEGAWVKAAYAHRRSESRIRARNEAALFQRNKQLYQRKFCARQQHGGHAVFRNHCRGDSCPNFAHPRPHDQHGPLPVDKTIAVPQSADSPLISCIMPTRNRQKFVGSAIANFLAQDYLYKELIVVDDGDEAVRDLVSDHPQVRYFRLEGTHSTGYKRNFANKQAIGQLIAHWDDDDCYPRWRLSTQQRVFENSRVQLAGTSCLYFVDLQKDDIWLYSYLGTAGTWVSGNSMMYRKDFWQRHRFENIRIGEDSRFCLRANGSIHDMKDPMLGIATIHDGNTSKRQTASRAWRKVDSDAVRIQLDQHFAREVNASEKVSVSKPLVSCIMPTYNRRAFIPMALDNFLSQDYPVKELIVVDDGTENVADLFEDLDQVKYIRIPRKISIGEKRNIAVEAAAGEYIAHWDDDDWYAADRLSHQMQPLLDNRCDINGLENTVLLTLDRLEFWGTNEKLRKRMFVGDVIGGTLVYRRTFWTKGARYPLTNLAEDAAFLKDVLAMNGRLMNLENNNRFIYVRHKTNTWEFKIGEFIDRNGWFRIESPELHHVLQKYRKLMADGNQRTMIESNGSVHVP